MEYTFGSNILALFSYVCLDRVKGVSVYNEKPTSFLLRAPYVLGLRVLDTNSIIIQDYQVLWVLEFHPFCCTLPGHFLVAMCVGLVEANLF